MISIHRENKQMNHGKKQPREKAPCKENIKEITPFCTEPTKKKTTGI
jgi:hypothetical protein